MPLFRGRYVINVPASLKHQYLRRHLGGIFISQVGDQIQSFALAIAVYVQTQDMWATCMLALIRMSTMALGTWIGGRFADRFARRTLMIFIQVPLIVMPAYLCWWSFRYGNIPIAMTYILLIGVYILMAMEENAQAVVSQEMVRKEEIEGVIYLMSMMRNLAFTMGSLGAGFVLILAGMMGWLFASNALSYVPLLILYLCMPYGRKSTFVSVASAEEVKPKVSYGEAKAYLRRHNPVGYRAYRWSWIWHMITTNGQVMYILISFDLLDGTSAYTALMATSMISGGIITLAYSGIVHRVRPLSKEARPRSIRPILVWGCILMFSYAVMGVSQILWISIVAHVAMSFGLFRLSNVIKVLMQCGTRPEEAISKAYEGRVKGLFVLANALGGVFCNLLACVIIQLTGDVRAVSGLTLLGLLIFFCGFIVEVRYELLIFLVIHDLISRRGINCLFVIYRWIKVLRISLIRRLVLFVCGNLMGGVLLMLVTFSERQVADC